MKKKKNEISSNPHQQEAWSRYWFHWKESDWALPPSTLPTLIVQLPIHHPSINNPSINPPPTPHQPRHLTPLCPSPSQQRIPPSTINPSINNPSIIPPHQRHRLPLHPTIHSPTIRPPILSSIPSSVLPSRHLYLRQPSHPFTWQSSVSIRFTDSPLQSFIRSLIIHLFTSGPTSPPSIESIISKVCIKYLSLMSNSSTHPSIDSSIHHITDVHQITFLIFKSTSIHPSAHD